MQAALAHHLKNSAEFADASVSEVAPCVDRDGARAVAVNLEPRPREGSLLRAAATIAVVCPHHDEARFAEMTAAAGSFDGFRGRISADGRTWCVIRFALLRVEKTRTVDGYLHGAATFDATYKEED